MWYNPYIVKCILKKGAYELVYFEGNCCPSLEMGSISISIMLRLFPKHLLYFVILNIALVSIYGFRGDNFSFDFLWKESMGNSMYLGFTNGACQYTKNLAFIAWLIHYPSSQLLVENDICIG